MLASYQSRRVRALLALFLLAFGLTAGAQSGGNSAPVNGTVVDPSGASVPSAVLEIRNPVSGYSRTATTDTTGRFTIPNVPFNNYHLTATAKGFAPFAQDIDVRSTVPVSVPIHLDLETTKFSVTVEGSAEDLLEKKPTFHTDVDRDLFRQAARSKASHRRSVPWLSLLPRRELRRIPTACSTGWAITPRIPSRSDGQPITDQQSKVFSNQIPVDSVAVHGGDRRARRRPSMAARPAW